MSGRTIALIGFGEVGQALAAELARHPQKPVLRAHDLKFADPASAPSCAAKAAEVQVFVSAAEAALGADLVISAVTAAQTVAAAQAVAPGIGVDVRFIDLNSASPQAKQAAAEIIDGAGGRYVEAAVMSPIEPKRLASPMLLGGTYAEGALADLAALGFTGARFYSPILGKAAAAKLSRSVVIKGMEALVTESLLTARFYGVEDEVLGSLSNLFPRPDWEDYALYLISRALQHGVRRAEEMREAAVTVAGAHLEPLMSEATAARQEWTAALPSPPASFQLRQTLDFLRGELGKGEVK